MYDVFLSFVCAFLSCYFILPSIIHVARLKHLCDEPGSRHSHTEKTPSLGGIGIFVGVMFSMIFWIPSNVFSVLQYNLCAFIVIFLAGVKDDIVPLSALKKLFWQIVAASIVVVKANIKITSLHGFLGINEIPEWFSIGISIFTIIVIINAFNLIDGINGLSGCLAVIISLTYGTWFYLADKIVLAIMAYSLAGAVLAFLRYNFTPARIFMGDTGALLIGLMLSIFTIQFIEINGQLINIHPFAIRTGPAFAIAVLILPLFDTLRVFVIRILRGNSPFKPDRLHIHHLLLNIGFTHMQATAFLSVISILFILLALLLQNIGTFQLIALIVAIAWTLSFVLQHVVEQRKLHLTDIR
jgi:UDP-GlcNAc:undecaprenyl-phosphate/decaprenyl-phosphate GlcNAc-1-phosphate transferase